MVVGKGVVQQGCVIVPVVGIAEGDGDKGGSHALGGGDQSAACRLGVAGLKADTALVAAQELVVVFHIPLPKGDGLGGDDLRQHGVGQHGAGDERHVVGGGIMPLHLQPIWVGKVGVLKTQVGGLLIHELGKGLHISGDVDGDGHGCVIARAQKEAVEQMAQRQFLVVVQIHRGSLGAHSSGVHGDRFVQVIGLLRGHQGGHQLGDGGDGALCVGVFGIDHTARPGVHDHRAGGGGLKGAGRDGERTKKKKNAQQGGKDRTQPSQCRSPRRRMVTLL